MGLLKESRVSDPLIMGAVAYDQKVVPIWDGFRQYFRTRGLEFDYVLFSNYERQVEATCGGTCTSRGILRWRGFRQSGSPTASAGAPKPSACGTRIAT